jgi:predicted ATPase/class 3 adenylate cyclase
MNQNYQTGERQQLEQAISGLEAQRAILGDAVVEPAIAALRHQIAALEPAPAQQRKLATILFMDIAGHTALTINLDPEEQMAVVDAALARLAAQVEEYGGHVARYQGDGFKAVFGLPVAQENDPAQAVRAGLAIQDEAKAVAAELAARRGLTGFQVRVGITTGLIFAGGETEGQDTIKGAAVNLAARLESAAEPGTVLISRETLSHVRGIFDVQALAPIRAKGFTAPVPVYQVLRVKARPFYRGRRGVEGVETRMVGRELEFLRLQKVMEEVLAEGERQMVTVVGEAGLGKSRLLYEFENWVDLHPETVWLFKGRARLETQGQPYALLRDLFAFRFAIQDDDPAQRVREKLVQGFAEALGAAAEFEQQAHIVGQLLGYDFRDSPHLSGLWSDPAQLRDRAWLYMLRYFQAVAARTPVLILLEDLHWADDSSLDTLNQLALRLEASSVILVATTRHVLLERRPHWGEGQDFHRRLYLAPLSKRDSRRLLAEVLQNVPQIPDALLELVVTNAEGNPFYVEELVKMLVEEGVILPGEEVWQVAEQRLAEIQVPGTLMGVLQARLDGLPGAEKVVLQQASVVGRVFWDRVLEHINTAGEVRPPENDIADVLADLHGRELVYRRETSAFAEAREHIFKHALLRDVTYESVLKSVRRTYHALVAEWLQAHAGERAGEVTALIADHLDRAGDESGARHYLRRAGEEAATTFANEEAVEYFSRALALTPPDHLAQRYDLHLARGQVYDLLGAREAQAADLAALEKLAEALEDRVKEAEIALRQARLAENISDFPAAIHAAQRAVSLAQAGGNREMEAAGYLEWGRTLWRKGTYEEAMQRLNQALEGARKGGYRLVEAHALRHLAAVIAKYEYDYPLAIDYNHQCLRVYRELGHRRGEAAAINNLGTFMRDQWDHVPAREYYRAALDLSREMGDRFAESIVMLNLGMTYGDLGDYPAAQDYFEQGLHISRQIGFRSMEGDNLFLIGYIALTAGDYAGAQTYAEKALAIHRAIDQKGIEKWAWWLFGEALAGLGRPDPAEAAYLRSLREGEGISARFPVFPREGLARIYLSAGKLEQALEQVEVILEKYGTHQKELEEFNLSYMFQTCFQVLQAGGDPRAAEVLETGYTVLQEKAAKISDPALRQSFLQNAYGNQELIALYQQMQSGK